MEQAICRNTPNPDLWFPSSMDLRGRAAAIETCNACPARSDCLEFALRDASLEGIWGGTTVEERRQMRRRVG